MNRRSLLLGAAGLAGCGRASSLCCGDDLDTVIDAAMQRIGAAPGLSVAVYSPDGVYARGFGVSDVTTGARADADTAFYIASCTKPLTALALASMAERVEAIGGSLEVVSHPGGAGTRLTAIVPLDARQSGVRQRDVSQSSARQTDLPQGEVTYGSTRSPH